MSLRLQHSLVSLFIRDAAYAGLLCGNCLAAPILHQSAGSEWLSDVPPYVGVMQGLI